MRAAIWPATFIGADNTERRDCWWISASQKTSGLDLLEALLERVGVALAFHLAMKFMIPAEFHGGSLNARALSNSTP